MTDAPNRPLKVFPSTGSGHRLCHAHPDADAEAVRALYARLKADGVELIVGNLQGCARECII